MNISNIPRLKQARESYYQARNNYGLLLGTNIDDYNPREIAELSQNPQTADIIKDFLEIYCFPDYREVVEAEITKLRAPKQGQLETEYAQRQPSCTVVHHNFPRSRTQAGSYKPESALPIMDEPDHEIGC